jgi:hypothetical protein
MGAILEFPFNSIYETLAFMAGIFLVILMIVAALLNNITAAKYVAVLIICVCSPLSLFLDICDRTIGEREILRTVATILWIICVDVVVYRSYLDIKFRHQKDIAKAFPKHFFTDCNVELLLLSIIACLPFIDGIWDPVFDNSHRTLILFVGIFIVTPMFLGAFSNNLKSKRNVVMYSVCFYSPLALRYIYRSIEEKGVFYAIVSILWLIFIDVVMYHRYLDCKFSSREV